MCRKHPSQDHGQRAAKLVSQAAGASMTGNKSATDLIQMQIQKLQNEAKGTADEDQDAYRLTLERDRINAEKRKRRHMSSAHLELATKSGLHASVLSAMMAPDSDDESVDSSSSSSTGSEKKKKSKKSKKSSKKNKKEKSKKEKKEKEKEKKSKKRKKKRRRISSDDGHSYSSGSEVDGGIEI